MRTRTASGPHGPETFPENIFCISLTSGLMNNIPPVLCDGHSIQSIVPGCEAPDWPSSRERGQDELHKYGVELQTGTETSCEPVRRRQEAVCETDQQDLKSLNHIWRWLSIWTWLCRTA